jgi:uncharacterized lipoprotein YajG
MTMFIRLLLTGFVTFTLSSCSYQSQVVRLNPVSLQLSPVSTGSHPGEVVLTTRDARAMPEIGRRAAGSHSNAAITTDTDIAALLQTQMTEILKAKGYRALPQAPSPIPTLDVQLKELSYAASDASGERKVKVKIVLEALVKNELKTFRNTYKAEQERKIVFEPVAKSNEEWINEAFALALQELANDSKLYSHLE